MSLVRLGCHFAPWENRCFTQGLVLSSGEYPVLKVKRSLLWPIAEKRLTILATGRTGNPE